MMFASKGHREMEADMKTILAADIGGTHSRFAVFAVGPDRQINRVESKWLETRRAGSFEDLLDLLNDVEFPLEPSQADAAVFAVAGPVQRETFSRPPNIDWEIDLAEVRRRRNLGVCALINDFAAQAFACRSPIIQTARQILDGDIDRAAPLAVVGAGTGLGQSTLVTLPGNRYHAVPSEGGHTSFPFETEAEFAYMKFLLRETGEAYIRTETVLSGRGLSRVHQFLTGEKRRPAEVSKTMGPDSDTLRWMARFYGRVCRNYALQVLALGGLYIAGGVAAKAPQLVTHAEFGKTFRQTASMAHVLGGIPVFLNTNEESGLWGAAVKGLQLLEEPRPT
jgi:glucokinase